MGMLKAADISQVQRLFYRPIERNDGPYCVGRYLLISKRRLIGFESGPVFRLP